MKSHTRDHLAPGDEQKEWFAWRTTFEADELLNRALIDRAAESIHGLSRVCEHLSSGEMTERSVNGGLDLLRRPERHHHRLGLHSRKILSASANAKSVSSVILRARSLPRSTTTGSPICSQRALSSVATRSAARASRCARSMTSRGNAWGVCARQS